MPAPKYPPKTPGIPRTHQSEVEEFLRCGLRWQFRQESQHRWAMVRMIVGSAVSIGALHDSRTRITTGRFPRTAEIVDAAVAGYEAEVAEAEIPESRIAIAQGKDDAACATRCYAERVSPELHPTEAEEPIVAQFQEGFQFCGTPDVMEAEGIGDLKTGKQWPQSRADGARQLTGYGELFRARRGVYPARLWIDSIYQKHGRWFHSRLETSRTPQQYAAYRQVIQMALQAMDRGVILPAPEGAWWCSQAQCPFWDRCPATGGR